MIKTRTNIFSTSRLPTIVCLTAISYFLFYYLLIHTITTTEECSYLDEFWLGGTSRADHPLGLFTTIAVLLLLFTIVDFFERLKNKLTFKKGIILSYTFVAFCIIYWLYGLYQLYEVTLFERGYRNGDWGWYETSDNQNLFFGNVPKVFRCINS